MSAGRELIQCLVEICGTIALLALALAFGSSCGRRSAASHCWWGEARKWRQ